MKIKIVIAVFSFLVLFCVYCLYLEDLKKNDIDNVLNLKTQSLKVAKDAILDTYLSVNKKYYFDIINDKEIMDILKKFKYASKDEKDILRGELYRKLYKQYDLLKKLHINQFHFHTFNGKSLLRFHVPYLNGDYLLDVRETIKKVIGTKKTVTGFEGGRIYSGFRYVFPLFDKDDYLGSVEFSITFDGIEEKLKNILDIIDTYLILKKEISYDKVFKPYRALFRVSKFDKNYFYEDSSILKEKYSFKNQKLIDALIKKVKKDNRFKTKFKEHQNFSVAVIYKDKGYSVTFLNIKDVKNEDAGYIVSFENFDNLISIEDKYQNLFFIGFFVLFVLFVLVVVIIYQVQEIKKEAKKLQKVIDIQDSIIILTDGKQFKYANKSFLEFFNFNTLNQFLKQNKCICSYFLNKKGFFNLNDIKDKNINWIEALLQLPPRKRIVSMKDVKDNIIHAFSVSINKYDKKNYIISFNDISDTIEEKLELEKEMVKDKLTLAYNRTYFDKNINRLIKTHKAQKLKTGIIFFDIDFFKNINDTFGHDKGDEVLKDLVKIIKYHIRHSDKLIRWGGEEFIVIAPVHNMDELYIIAEHLRKSVEEFNFGIRKQITCSFGLAVYDENENILVTIKRADERLYKAKNRGRNRVVSD